MWSRSNMRENSRSQTPRRTNSMPMPPLSPSSTFNELSAALTPLQQWFRRASPELFVPVDPFARPEQQPDGSGNGLTHSMPENFSYRTILRPVYHSLLFNIPSIYFSPISKVIHSGASDRETRRREVREEASSFGKQWVELLDDLKSEWSTLSVVSSLLISSILTLFQTDAINHPITLTAAFLSLVAALMSLIYACYYTVRFGNLKIEWAAVGFTNFMYSTRGHILWNPLVMLSLPAVWLCWSLIFIWVGLLSFMWTSDNPGATPDQTPQMVLGARIAVTIVFGIGLVYLYLIVRTFKKRILLQARDYDLESGLLKMNHSVEDQVESLSLHRSSSSVPKPDVTEPDK